MTLLSSAVHENDVAKPSVDARRLIDHKMAPQKRVLEDFAIKFPSSKARAMQKRCSMFVSDQEEVIYQTRETVFHHISKH